MPFNEQELNKQNFFQKILNKQPKNNAIIELNNKLALTDLLSVTPDDVQSIAFKYKINFKQKFKPELLKMYEKYMNHCLVDKELSDDEINKLKHLKQIFLLNDKEIQAIQDKTVQAIYKSEVDSIISDGKISDEEKKFLDDLRSKLRLDDKNANAIFALSAQELLTKILNDSIVDERLSPEEDEQLNSIALNLGVEVKTEGATKAILDKYRLFWQIENGNLPVLNADINLQKSEICHFSVNVDWLEQRKVTQRVNYGGPTMRIKIAKGIYWRMGSMQVQSITKDVWQTIDSGTLYLTSKRLIFMGSKGNKTIKLDKILDFNVYKNGVDIQKDSGKSPFLEFSNNVDIFVMILGRLIMNEV